MDEMNPTNTVVDGNGGKPAPAGGRSFLIPGAIVVAGLVIAGAVVYTSGGFSSKSKNTAGLEVTAPNQAAVGQAAAVAEDNDPFIGDPKAPVTLIEFGDFQCPFCGKFFREVESKIIAKYVKTGQVRFVYRDFAFLGPESEDAAAAAECANEQGKFWQYHDYLYNHQSGENQGAFSRDNLKNFARTLGLSNQQFDSCLDTGKYTDKVRKDTADGRANGVNGTPGFLINGRLVVGALPFEQFDAAIQSGLAAKR